MWLAGAHARPAQQPAASHVRPFRHTGPAARHRQHSLGQGMAALCAGSAARPQQGLFHRLPLRVDRPDSRPRPGVLECSCVRERACVCCRRACVCTHARTNTHTHIHTHSLSLSLSLFVSLSPSPSLSLSLSLLLSGFGPADVPASVALEQDGLCGGGVRPARPHPFGRRRRVLDFVPPFAARPPCSSHRFVSARPQQLDQREP